jgi:hypothetical protein
MLVKEIFLSKKNGGTLCYGAPLKLVPEKRTKTDETSK